MRFVPTGCIREGMVLGKALYGKSGELLLGEGQVFIKAYIDRLFELQVNGVYIDDVFSKDIEIQNVISDEVRIQAVQGIKNSFMRAGREDPESKRIAVQQARAIVEDIVSEILDNKNLIVNMVDLKVFDEYTYYHSVNVAVLSTVVGVAMGMNREDLFALGLSALLHDIGKVFIDKDVINKPGRLTLEEFNEIKKHSRLGYDYLSNMFNIPVKSHLGILHHHERFDGSGYPKGLEREEISLFGRIIAVADVYDALVSDRPYRKAMLPSEAMEYIMGNADTMFDPNVAKIFAMKIAPYPLGTAVELSNGAVGLVVENYEGFGMRPSVKVFKESGIMLPEPYVLNLLTDPESYNITIVGISGELEPDSVRKTPSPTLGTTVA